MKNLTNLELNEINGGSDDPWIGQCPIGGNAYAEAYEAGYNAGNAVGRFLGFMAAALDSAWEKLGDGPVKFRF